VRMVASALDVFGRDVELHLARRPCAHAGRLTLSPHEPYEAARGVPWRSSRRAGHRAKRTKTPRTSTHPGLYLDADPNLRVQRVPACHPSRMSDFSRRAVLAAASVGVSAPLLIAQADGADASTAALIKTSKVPVGGGVILAGRSVVVTQSRAGHFHVFSAICTHQGCLVSQVANRRIDCPCHGSQFSIASGAPVAGPATTPLAKRPFKIVDGKIYLT
jgi:nitrite reductase/ring-hydroxylating ferredoxin subunit